MRSVLVTIAMLACAAPLMAQTDATPNLAPGIAMEQAGHAAQAAAYYRGLLQRTPASAPVLFALHRALRSGGGDPRSLIAPLDSALTLRPRDAALYTLAVRAWGELREPDTLAAVAAAWIAFDSADATPYREWAFALAQTGDLRGAHGVLATGHERLGGSALMREAAQLAVATGDWAEAAHDWTTSGDRGPDHVLSMTMALQQAPVGAHDGVIGALTTGSDVAADDSTARAAAALLLAGWGRADEGWVQLDRVLPADPDAATLLLQRFADRARGGTTPVALRARGYALERLASLQHGADARESTIGAAQAFADAGDRTRAAQILSTLARDPAAAGNDPDAAAMLIQASADAGRPAEAAARLAEWHDRLPPDVSSALAERIAWAWIRSGALDRADTVLAGDSTVTADALRGWTALFRGDVIDAQKRFHDAGPYAGDRDDATARTEALALIARVRNDTVPELGAGLLALQMGDTARAVQRLLDAAPKAGGRGGTADLLTYAGRLAAARGDSAAIGILTRAIAADSSGASAPAASFALGAYYLRAGRLDDARQTLERVILEYPESAVVPEARRLLDQARGAIPQS